MYTCIRGALLLHCSARHDGYIFKRYARGYVFFNVFFFKKCLNITVGKNPFTPMMKTQSLSHLVFTWKKHTFGFMSIKAMLKSILPIKIKVD